MILYLEIDIRPYLRMWKSKDNGTSNKKVMKTFYELFAQLKRSCHRRQRLCSQVAHTPYNQNTGKVSATAHHPVKHVRVG